MSNSDSGRLVGGFGSFVSGMLATLAQFGSRSRDYQMWDDLVNHGDELRKRFRVDHDPATLRNAVECFENAWQISSKGIGDVPYTLGCLANTLVTRFETEGRQEDLHFAIDHYRRALELIPLGHSRHCATLNNIANALMTRFEQLGDRADLEEAIVSYQAAFEMTPLGHPLRPSTVSNLADGLFTRFKHESDPADLDAAIKYGRGALEDSSLTDLDRPIILNNLAGASLNRFKQAGHTIDLEMAMVYGYNAMELTPPGHPSRSKTLNTIANTLMTCFDHAGGCKNIDDAIRYTREALELTPSGHRERCINLCSLASALTTRFEQSGDLADLDEAVANHHEAIALMSSGHHLLSYAHNNLSSILYLRFQRNGAHADLDEAIVHGRSAVRLRPFGNHLRCTALVTLANGLLTRFRLVEDAKDLDEAIANYRSAADLTQPGSHRRLVVIVNLGNALYARYDRSKELADLAESIDLFRSAIALAPPGHPAQHGILQNLSNTLLNQFEHLRHREDLDEAFVHANRALELTPVGHPNRFGTLNTVAAAAMARYNVDEDFPDLEEAITNRKMVLKLIPPSHPDRSDALNQLAKATMIRFEALKSLGQLITDAAIRDAQREILDLFEESTSAETGGPTSSRLKAALAWASISVEWSHPRALDAYRVSLGLLELLLAMGSSLESRHLRLTSSDIQNSKSLAVDAAACAIASGRLDVALELLEQGRSVLLTQAGKYRTPVDDLEVTHPKLANEFRMLCARMERSAMGMEPLNIEGLGPPADTVAVYQKLRRRWVDIIKEIRDLDAFSTFLKPIPYMALRSAAEEGPVIVLNFNQWRTDAIIIRRYHEPYLVPLTGVDAATINALAGKAHHRTSDTAFKKLLRYVWNTLVHPIVTVLQDNLHLSVGSRIWWCPTGAISQLPLHAAGDYSQRGNNLPDIFVSSYTPTLSALMRARQQPFIDSLKSGILFVGQPNTPGQPELPSVDLEMKRIQSSAANVTSIIGATGTRGFVLNAMTQYSWIHLACHGHVNQAQPFRSNFSLYDGPLTLLDITRQILPSAQLAFLSACHSAETNRDRPDETLHLAAGVQFSGFRSVVGTLWAMCDIDGPDIAGSFYSSLWGANGRAVAKSSAHALHRAVGELRRAPGVSFSRWTCFVHYGC